MSLLSFFRDLGGPGAPGAVPAGRSTGRVIPARTDPPVVRYVNALLSDVCEKGGVVTLDDRHSPPTGWSDPLPFGSVQGRLKVMAGLNPVPYREPVSRTFECAFRERRYRIEACFDDRPPQPSCTLRPVSLSDPGA
jgi:hypothetical protein